MAARDDRSSLRVLVDRGDLVRTDTPVSPNGRYLISVRQDLKAAWLVDVKRSRRTALPRGVGRYADVADDGLVVASDVDRNGFLLIRPGEPATEIGCGSFAYSCGRVLDLSADGRYVAAAGVASLELSEVPYVLDLATGVTKIVNEQVGEGVNREGLAGFAGDQLAVHSNPVNSVKDEPDQWLLFDFSDATSTPFLHAPRDQAVVSTDARYFTWVTRTSFAPADRDDGSRDVYQLDRTTGETTWISRPNARERASDVRRGSALTLAASPSGRYVTFGADARSLLGRGSTIVQAMIWDRRTGKVRIISRDDRGRLADRKAIPASIAEDAEATFVSDAGNLVRPKRQDEAAVFRLYAWKP